VPHGIGPNRLQSNEQPVTHTRRATTRSRIATLGLCLEIPLLMRRRLLLVLMGLATVSCGGSDASSRPLRFAVVPKALDLPVFSYAKIGAEREARILGNIEILWVAPDTADPEQQKAVLESLIAQGVDGIAISCTNAEVLSPSIDKAVAAGIPVITWDSDAPESARHAYYGADDFAAGQRLAQAAVEALDGKATVALMTSVGSHNLQRRLDGVLDVLGQHKRIRVVETFDVQEDMVRAQETIATATARYPSLSAWISVGAWPIMTRGALKPVDSSRTLVFSFDTIPPGPELLKAGKVHTLVGQKYFGWGSESVRLLSEIHAGRMPAQRVIDSGVEVVTRENVDEFLTRWHRLESGT
jgi:ribose transport system substrate-binding protein